MGRSGIVAARGDGGVDICLWDGDGWIIYQCKYHRRNIAWTKIDASLANLAAGTFLGSPVKQWWLVAPHNPTTAKYERLLKIGSALPFPTGWFGEDLLDGLAAKFPFVLEYYLGDGRSKLAKLVEDWDNIGGLVLDGVPVKIEAAQSRLSLLAESLGRQDPHFFYDFSVTRSAPTNEHVAASGALAVRMAHVNDYWVSTFLMERYHGAAMDSSDRMAIRLSVTDAAAGEGLARMLEVGGPLIELDASSGLSIELSELLGQPGEVGRLVLRPVADNTPLPLGLMVRESATATPVIVAVTRAEMTHGIAGGTARFASVNGAVTLEGVFRNDTGSMVLGVSLVPGTAVCSMDAELAFIRGLSVGTAIAVAPAHGPLHHLSWAQISPVRQNDAFVSFLAALCEIQRHSPARISVPKSIARADMMDALRLASFLRGEDDVQSWSSFTTVVSKRDALAGGMNDLTNQFLVSTSDHVDWDLNIDGQKVMLHELPRLVVLRTVRVVAIEESGDDVQMTCSPGTMHQMIWVRIPENADIGELQNAIVNRYPPTERESG